MIQFDKIIAGIDKNIIPDDSITIEETGLNQQLTMSRATCRDILISMLKFQPYITHSVVVSPIGGVVGQEYGDLVHIYIGGGLYRSIAEVHDKVGTFSVSRDPDISLTLMSN